MQIKGEKMTDFYKNKKVIVTGGSGFVGSHLVEQLIKLDANVVVVVDNFSRGNNKIDGAEYMRTDATSIDALKFFFKDTFAVFNLAARVAGVIYNQKNHLEMFYENVKLQTVPVMAADLCNVPHFLQVSSICTYAEEYQNPAIEPYGQLGNPVKANEGYSWSKRMGENAIDWAENIGHSVIIRPTNIYGPRDYFDSMSHVIPAIIKKVINDDVIVLNGTGHETREFIYVTDAASGIIHALEFGAHKEVFNLGTDGRTHTSIGGLVALIQLILGTNKPVEFVSNYDSGDSYRRTQCDKIQALGWIAKTSLQDGLTKTIQWYLNDSS